MNYTITTLVLVATETISPLITGRLEANGLFNTMGLRFGTISHWISKVFPFTNLRNYISLIFSPAIDITATYLDTFLLFFLVYLNSNLKCIVVNFLSLIYVVFITIFYTISISLFLTSKFINFYPWLLCVPRVGGCFFFLGGGAFFSFLFWYSLSSVPCWFFF